jgi:two-component system chemotaxis response regulator CheY
MPQLKTNLKLNDMKVLLVDDMRASRSQLQRTMSAMGFTKIDQVGGVIPAVEKMQSVVYDMIITGWKMPNGTGLDLLKACRQDGNYDNVAILLTSTETDPQSINEIMKEGASGYIPRPYTENDLVSHLEKALEWIERRKGI